MSEPRGWIFRLSERSMEIRARFYRPGLEYLDKIGITGNIITNTRLVLGVLFFYLFFKSMMLGALLSLLVLFLDTVDGSLARFQKKDNDRGKFLDVFVDRIIYIFIVSTFFFLNSNIYLVVYNLVIVSLVYVLAIIKNGEFLKSDWIIKPYPQASFVSFWPVVAFYLFTFFNVDLLDLSLIISSFLSTIFIIYYYIFIQYRWKKMFG